jgi:hypothetical protein
MKRENLKKANDINDNIVVTKRLLSSAGNISNIRIQIYESGIGCTNVVEKFEGSMKVVHLIIVEELKHRLSCLEKEYSDLDAETYLEGI